MSFTSATILLLLVMDPFGNIPFFMCVLEMLPKEQRQRVIIREMLIALVVLLSFLFAGPYIMSALQISEASLYIAGGIILFLIAIKMIFGGIKQMLQDDQDGDPLIVPLAIPSIAGPSAIATVLLIASQSPQLWTQWLSALLIAWGLAAVVLFYSTRLSELLGKRVINAITRLMGLILTVISVEMFLKGTLLAYGQ